MVVKVVKIGNIKCKQNYKLYKEALFKGNDLLKPQFLGAIHLVGKMRIVS